MTFPAVPAVCEAAANVVLAEVTGHEAWQTPEVDLVNSTYKLSMSTGQKPPPIKNGENPSRAPSLSCHACSDTRVQRLCSIPGLKRRDSPAQTTLHPN